MPPIDVKKNKRNQQYSNSRKDHWKWTVTSRSIHNVLSESLGKKIRENFKCHKMSVTWWTDGRSLTCCQLWVSYVMVWLPVFQVIDWLSDGLVAGFAVRGVAEPVLQLLILGYGGGYRAVAAAFAQPPEPSICISDMYRITPYTRLPLDDLISDG